MRLRGAVDEAAFFLRYHAWHGLMHPARNGALARGPLMDSGRREFFSARFAQSFGEARLPFLAKDSFANKAQKARRDAKACISCCCVFSRGQVDEIFAWRGSHRISSHEKGAAMIAAPYLCDDPYLVGTSEIVFKTCEAI